jgi:uroporphyrinogen-III synthase
VTIPRILLTRPRPESEKLAAALASEGWTPLIWPLFEIAPTGAAVDYAGAQAALFGSANAARCVPRPSPPIPAYGVGDATARAAEAAGFAPVESAGRDAGALVALVAARAEPTGGRLLFLRGEHVAADIAGALEAKGFAVTEIVVYAARPAGPPDPAVASALRDGSVRAAPIYSPRAAQAFAERAHALGARLDNAVAVAISPAAAEPLSRCGFARIDIAARPDGPAMRAAIAAALT